MLVRSRCWHRIWLGQQGMSMPSKPRLQFTTASASIWRRNGVRNVIAANIAVSDKTERVTVYLHEESNPGGTTIIAHQAATLETRIEAQMEAPKLQEIVPSEAIRARLFKIDVEGAEWLV